jgi:hypothetical protein
MQDTDLKVMDSSGRVLDTYSSKQEIPSPPEPESMADAMFAVIRNRYTHRWFWIGWVSATITIITVETLLRLLL